MRQTLQMKSITALELQENSSFDLGWRISNSNLIRLQLLDGSSRELVDPKLGRDFLLGSLEDGKTLGVFRKSTLRSVEFAFEQERLSNRLEYTRRAIGELLAGRQFPALARIWYLEPHSAGQQVPLIGVSRGFLVTDFCGSPAIPIAALGALELQL